MIPDTPTARSRLAFAALVLALYLIEADRVASTNTASILLFLAPAIAVIGVGHADGREGFTRAGLSVAALVVAGLLVNAAHGRGLPDYQTLRIAVSLLTGLFGLNLAIIVMTSALLRRLWPQSDRWTQ